MGVFFFIVLGSGKLVEYLVDTYVMGANTAKDLTKSHKDYENNIALLKGAKFGDVSEKKGLFKTEDQLDEELSNCHKIKPNELKIDGFFGHGRNFFVWVK